MTLITYKYQKILQRAKAILWNEPINPVDWKESEDMDSDLEWEQKVVENLLLEEEQKEEKKYPLN